MSARGIANGIWGLAASLEDSREDSVHTPTQIDSYYKILI